MLHFDECERVVALLVHPIPVVQCQVLRLLPLLQPSTQLPIQPHVGGSKIAFLDTPPELASTEGRSQITQEETAIHQGGAILTVNCNFELWLKAFEHVASLLQSDILEVWHSESIMEFCLNMLPIMFKFVIQSGLRL